MMNVTLQALPGTLGEFQTLLQAAPRSPEYTCALFLSALHLYLQKPDDGLQALDLLRGPRPMNGFDRQFIRDRLRGKAYLTGSYFAGATPQNNYTPTTPYVLEVLPDPRPQDVEEGYIRVYLKSAGADSPRPIRLRRKGDAWCLWEYSSILSGIRIPAAGDPWA